MVNKLSYCLSKWKVKTLSICGRLTLLKAVLGSSPLYNMSIFKVPKGVLKVMEGIRSKFFNGFDSLGKKIIWAAWPIVLASKKNGGLGVSIFYALNRALLLKWIWRFTSQDEISVAGKVQGGIVNSFRRLVRTGVEDQQLVDITSLLSSVSLSLACDRWVCDISGDGEFRVKEVRSLIDNLFLPRFPKVTRWVRYVPIKINVFAWRARRDFLPTRSNLVRRGIAVDSPVCPLCLSSEEDGNHVFFGCGLAANIFRRLCRWWDLEWQDLSSFSEWYSGFSSVRLSSKVKDLLEGVCYIAWWTVWGFRNRTIFNDSTPRRSVLFDDIVSLSFN
nr:RNA-directed DNA polymerase, eukaryota [Tanacetum cinerariifolium]